MCHNLSCRGRRSAVGGQGSAIGGQGSAIGVGVSTFLLL